MASNLKLANAAVNAAADAVCALLDGGYLRIYAGTQPATGDTPASGQALLAELRFENPAFREAVKGVAIANTMIPEDSARGTGTATWFRCMTSGGAAVFDGSVGTSDADINLSMTAIHVGAPLTLSSFSYSQPATGY